MDELVNNVKQRKIKTKYEIKDYKYHFYTNFHVGKNINKSQKMLYRSIANVFFMSNFIIPQKPLTKYNEHLGDFIKEEIEDYYTFFEGKYIDWRDENYEEKIKEQIEKMVKKYYNPDNNSINQQLYEYTLREIFENDKHFEFFFDSRVLENIIITISNYYLYDYNLKEDKLETKLLLGLKYLSKYLEKEYNIRINNIFDFVDALEKHIEHINKYKYHTEIANKLINDVQSRLKERYQKLQERQGRLQERQEKLQERQEKLREKITKAILQEAVFTQNPKQKEKLLEIYKKLESDFNIKDLDKIKDIKEIEKLKTEYANVEKEINK